MGLAVLISCAAGMAVGLGSIALGPTARLDQLLRAVRRSDAEGEAETESEAEMGQAGSLTLTLTLILTLTLTLALC